MKFVFGLQKDPIFFKRQKGTALNRNRQCVWAYGLRFLSDETCTN